MENLKKNKKMLNKECNEIYKKYVTCTSLNNSKSDICKILLTKFYKCSDISNTRIDDNWDIDSSIYN